MSIERSLKGRTLFITGASRGIGLAIAVMAAADGANIALVAKTVDPNPCAHTQPPSEPARRVDGDELGRCNFVNGDAPPRPRRARTQPHPVSIEDYGRLAQRACPRDADGDHQAGPPP